MIDRWNGYQPQEQLEQVREWELVEEKKKNMREEKVKMGLKVEDEFGIKEEEGEGVEQRGIFISIISNTLYLLCITTHTHTHTLSLSLSNTHTHTNDLVDAKSRMTVRNLRIREDTAKYLRNLNLDSAYYDPKTRSMRENPYDKDPKDLLYAGDNFERYGGSVQLVTELKDFAWSKTKNGGVDAATLSLQSNPTMAEKLYKDYEKEKDQGPVVESSVLNKYGGEEHLTALPKELMVENDEWIEYNSDGKVIKGQVKVVRSRWPEDIMVGNHSTVWGSYWEEGQWGFACCQSLIKGSYCGGVQAIQAKLYQKERLEKTKRQPKPERPEMVPTKTLMEVHKESLKGKGKATLQLEKILAAEREEKERLELEIKKIKEEEALERRDVGNRRDENEVDRAKRNMKSAHVVVDSDTGTFLRKKRKWELTEEERESFRVLQHHKQDPMANYLDKK
jgi:pre-mRNA-processing factor SLU7